MGNDIKHTWVSIMAKNLNGDFIPLDMALPESLGVINGTTNATPNTADEITFDAAYRNITIACPIKVADVENAKVLQVSFDVGDSFLELHPGDAIDAPAELGGVIVKSTSASCPYVIVGAALEA